MARAAACSSSPWKATNHLSSLHLWSDVPPQDKAQPETQARAFGDVSFNAVLAIDDPSATPLVRQPGSDGFRLDSTPMFQVLFVFSASVVSYSSQLY